LDEDSRDNAIEKLEDRDGGTATRELARKESHGAIYTALATLTPREARVIQLRYGLGQFRSHTLNEIGWYMKLSRERVRQIEGAAIRKLRECDTLADILGTLGGS
jgi:RNA polymerase primary sigma factor